MPLIIAATDFSDVAENAIHYACKLAVAVEAEVMVLNCYSLPVVFSDMPVPSPIVDTEKLATDSMKEQLVKFHAEYPQLSITSSVVYGDIVEAIEEFAEEHEGPMLVVAGNDYNNDTSVWIESTLLHAMRDLEYPVLAVPAGTDYTQVRKIGFAYDNTYAGSDMALLELREFAEKLNAELHVFFAHHNVMEDEKLGEINAAAQQILAPVNPLYHVFYEQDVDTAIQDYAAKYNIDWLVVMPRKHSFIEGLFHKSHTKVMVNHCGIPLLALHHN